MRGIKTKERGKWKKAAAFVVLLLVLGVLTNSVRKVYNKKEDAKETLARMEAEMKSLQERQQFLAASIERLNTTEGVAFEMRKKLNVAEAGESVAIIVEEEPAPIPPSAKISSWQKFKNFVISLFR